MDLPSDNSIRDVTAVQLPDTSWSKRELAKLDMIARSRKHPELRPFDASRMKRTWDTLTPREKQDDFMNMVDLGLDIATLGEAAATKAGAALVGTAAKRIEAGMQRMVDHFLHPKLPVIRKVPGGPIGTEATAVPPILRDGEWIKGTSVHKEPNIAAEHWPFKLFKNGRLMEVRAVPPKQPTGTFDWKIVKRLE